MRDANGQSIAYIYSRENEDEARQAKVLTAGTLPETCPAIKKRLVWIEFPCPTNRSPAVGGRDHGGQGH